MSKGRRLVTATGIALAVAFCVQMGLAQGPSPAPDGTAPAAPAQSPATKTTPKKVTPKRPDATPPSGPVVDPFPVVPAPTADDNSQGKPLAPAVEAVPVEPREASSPVDPSSPANGGTPTGSRFTFDLSAAGQQKDRKAGDGQVELLKTEDARAPGQLITIPGSRDDRVMRVQTPGGSNTPPPVPEGAVATGAGDGAGDGCLLKPESLPVGPHAVGLTVDVRAPAAVNLNVKTTLSIYVKNSGTTDAQGVVVREPLPDGLEFIDSQPARTPGPLPMLVWNLGNVPAGAERRITLQVRATKKIGPIDHAPTISMLTGGRARMAVREPKLKVEQRPSVTQLLKGAQVRYSITVTNTGDGPARDVILQAKLGSGLRHREGTTIELPLKDLDPPRPALKPGETVDLDLVAEAVASGEQQCELTATSIDVVPGAGESKATSVVVVTEPKLTLKVKGPAKRYTGNVAAYHLIVENTGTAPTKGIRAAAVLPISGGRLVSSPDATWEKAKHRLVWEVGDLDPGKTADLPFSVQLDGEQTFRIDAAAVAIGIPTVRQSGSTIVSGMADVKFGVRERKRVIDVGEDTVYEITIRNDGSSEAQKLLVKATLSEHLKVENTLGTDTEGMRTADFLQVKFPQIDRLAAGAEMVLTIQAKGVKAGNATCKVALLHDDIDETSAIQHTATTTVTDPN